MLWVLSCTAIHLQLPPAGPLLLSCPMPISCSTHRYCCLLLPPWGHVTQLWGHRKSRALPVSPSNDIPGRDMTRSPLLAGCEGPQHGPGCKTGVQELCWEARTSPGGV